MRPYKAKTINSDVWVYGWYFEEPVYNGPDHKPTPNRHWIRQLAAINNCVTAHEVDGDTVCQYIGLNDKNGINIYEHDYIYSQYHNPNEYEVVFREGGYCAIYGNDSTMPIDIDHFYPSTGPMITVVENKYDRKPDSHCTLGDKHDR